LAGSGVMIDAVEPNPAWAAECKPHYRNVLVGTIEDAPIEEAVATGAVAGNASPASAENAATFAAPGDANVAASEIAAAGAAVQNEKYGVIVCADVLEHTPDPVGILKKLHRVAAPDAVYIISLPNIAHIAVRMMLLFGKFPKMERGILDKTHLQFLTQATAKQMLDQAGLQITRISSTGVPLDEIWPKGEGSMIYNALVGAQHAALAILPKLFAMQFVFEARRKVS
jgi:SAM-dependent methyltransferase